MNAEIQVVQRLGRDACSQVGQIAGPGGSDHWYGRTHADGSFDHLGALKKATGRASSREEVDGKVRVVDSRRLTTRCIERSETRRSGGRSSAALAARTGADVFASGGRTSTTPRDISVYHNSSPLSLHCIRNSTLRMPMGYLGSSLVHLYRISQATAVPMCTGSTQANVNAPPAQYLVESAAAAQSLNSRTWSSSTKVML